MTDIFRPKIKCKTLFGGTLCLCEVSRFLSKFLTDYAAATLGAGDDFRGPSGQVLPLPLRFSLLRAGSFLRNGPYLNSTLVPEQVFSKSAI